MPEDKKSSLKPTIFAALALAFASFGDAFLYPFLPLNGDLVGVPLVWIGVLLSINRFVRIFSNGWMVHLFAQHGLRLVTIVAVIMAIASTAGYGLATGVISWLIFRIMWGLSFSAMRISSLGYALKQPHQQGFALGLSRGFYEIGPMLALIVGPIILQYLGVEYIFWALGILSLPALYFAFQLPKGEDYIPPKVGRLIVKFPTMFNSITFLSAFLIDGIVIIVLGVLFLKYRGGISPLMATSLAAFYLSYRRICLVIFSPAGGWLADQVGLSRVFNVSLFLVVVGLFVAIMGWIEVGSIIVFAFYSILSAITPGNVSQSGGHQLEAVAENSTWRDIGAAFGTLFGGFLLSSPYLINVISVTSILLMFLLFIQMGLSKKVLRFIETKS